LILGMDSRFHYLRPLFWVLLVLLGLISFGLSGGNVSIQSGDTSVGGDEQAWLTSEFSNGLMLPMVAFLFYSFFAAVAAGMAVPRDEELNVGPILHSTRLRPGEYVWAKFSAVLLMFLVVLAVHLVLAMFFNHLWPHDDADRFRGPFELANYLRPALLMTLPFVLFICGSSFAVGTVTRRPILVFAAPTALFLVSVFFLWEWSPSDLDPAINRWLMWLEPSGFRWINETWIKLDRGVEFYNRQPVGYDAAFLASRLVWAVAGILCVVGAHRHFAATIRAASKPARRGWLRRRRAAAVPAPAPQEAVGVPTSTLTVGALGMGARAPGFLRAALTVARFESYQLARQPGLYIFVPLILIQVIFSAQLEVGAFDTPLLLTPGTAAVLGMGMLTTLVCLLLLFYTVESVLRENQVRLSPVFWATPSRTAAVLLGKALANGIVGFVIVAAATLGSVIVILTQGKVTPDLSPYLLVWGALLLPTFLAWAAFVTLVVALTGNRYVTYAVGLATMIFTAWKNFKGEMNWVGNWNLWGTVTWTDFGALDPNGEAFLLNRVFWMLVTAFMVALTVRVFPRREHDSGLLLDRLRPRALLVGALRLTPAALPAIAVGSFLWVQVGNGAGGPAVEKREKEYWGRNLHTWGVDVNTPRIAGVDVDLELDPPRGWFRVNGSYVLTNRHEDPIHRFPMSVGDHFEDVTWTLDGREAEPEHRARLYVFRPDEPIALGDSVTVGFSHEGALPRGLTKNGGGLGEFVMESGVVLTSFSTSFLPLPWFEEGRGQDEHNQTDPREFDVGYWEGETDPAFAAGALFPVRTRITGPEEYAYHGVGVLREETVEDGRRTAVWETDSPVNFFNVVAGKWDVWKGDGVEIHYHPEHTYNIEEMGEALEGARRYYSEWFYEYPWQDLRLNEFPGVASYAQGFPTNITFSESIGFLTRSTPETQVAFLVTAHETAHQWWGNILLPGEGPGGNLLAEGMAHFSTILLFGEMKGGRERIEFCKRIEDGY
ncbi:MAG TPA: ABC transporter permease, partial [bacterium]|nr:ABC transporter permease [bacterium]